MLLLLHMQIRHYFNKLCDNNAYYIVYCTLHVNGEDNTNSKNL